MSGLVSVLFPVALIGGLAALAIGLYVIGQRRERQRDLEYAEYAQAHNFQYLPSRDGAQVQYAPILPFFHQGSYRKWRHEISGSMGGHQFAAFEYLYTVSTGRSTYTYREAIVKWENSDTNLPYFIVAPETFINRIGQSLFGAQDVDFPEDPEFSSAYVLKGDPTSVTALFTPAVRGFLTANPGQHVAGAGHVLFWWRANQELPPAPYLDPFLSAGAEVARLFLG
jgi:hypothetical protein